MAGEVKNLEEILLPKYLGKNRKIIQCETKRLTEAGENYGSLMLALDLKLKNTVDDTEDVLHVVAKAVPNNEFIRQMFQSHVTFKKELGFYRTVVPSLKKFALERGVDNLLECFPKYYGGRLGKGPNFDTFDDDAVILLENLKTRGFVCEDRRIGLDLETAKLVLKEMSTFHAVPVALKLKEPDVFKQKVLPYLNHTAAFENFEDDGLNYVLDETLKIGEESSRCAPYLKNLREAMISAFKWFEGPTPPREPFATLVHSDFWINNVMVNKDTGSVKIVDYQFIEYMSPVRDIILFIFVSVQSHLVPEYYDHLLEFYHQNYVETLARFNVDTKPFSLDKFKEEIDLGVKELALSQCIIMVKPICAEKHVVKNVDDVSKEDFMRSDEIPQRQKEMLWMIIEEFGKRGWI